MECYCLLDANSLIKYYVDSLSGSAVIKYILDKSPSKIIYLSTVQAEEFISLIYMFRRRDIIDSDEKLVIIKDTFLNDINKKFFLYDFVREHLKDFDVPSKITEVPPPKKLPLTYIRWHDGVVPLLKDIADTGDAIMLKIIREINLLSGGSCFLVTSDGHVKKVAEALNLKVIDPEKMGINDLPEELDTRIIKRENIKLRAICVDCDSSLKMATTRTINICNNGLCLEAKNPLDVGSRLRIRLSTYDGHKMLENIEGRVAWYDSAKTKAGVQFINPVNSVLFSS